MVLTLSPLLGESHSVGSGPTGGPALGRASRLLSPPGRSPARSCLASALPWVPGLPPVGGIRTQETRSFSRPQYLSSSPSGCATDLRFRAEIMKITLCTCLQTRRHSALLTPALYLRRYCADRRLLGLDYSCHSGKTRVWALRRIGWGLAGLSPCHREVPLPMGL